MASRFRVHVVQNVSNFNSNNIVTAILYSLSTRVIYEESSQL